jgi:general stress protein 26
MADDRYPEAKLWDMIAEIRVAMLTTHHGDRLESRPMHTYLDRDERCLWFITTLDSAKAHDVEDGAAVNLAFVDIDESNYVSLNGRGYLVRDAAKQKELWNAFAEAWLPQGPEAPEVGLIRVDPIDATYWDSPSGRLATFWEIAKATATQTPPKSDEVRKVNLG